jgi:Leucine-rich repeat (LRR) protein
MNLNQLKIVDLSANNLTKLPSLQNTTVDILGNSKISCINISAALEKDVKFFNKEKSLCESEVVYWFNDTASITISDVEKRKKLEYDCPEKCRCKPGHMQYSNIEENKKDHLIFISDVDCSNSGLTNLPTKLPENTYYLNITNNSISSLSALVTNDYYLNIKSLFADDNLITSIVDLEGSKFLENFTVLSLKNNKIKDIPYYILSNLGKNYHGKVSLGIQCKGGQPLLLFGMLKYQNAFTILIFDRNSLILVNFKCRGCRGTQMVPWHTG